MTAEELTERQTSILKYVFRYWQRHGRPPTLREITAHHRYQDHSTVVQHLAALERKGFIERQPGRSRGIRFLEATWELFGVPLVGRIPAGTPRSEAEYLGAITPDSLYPQGENVFALRVSGRSMVDAGILPNDLIFVREDVETKPGDIVVARTDDQLGEATVKRLSQRNGELWLDPESDDEAHEPIPLNDGDVIGKVVGVHRTLR